MTAIISTPRAMAGVSPNRRELATGDYLFRQGDKSFGIFLMGSGIVRLQRTTPDGSVISIHLARAGEMFAEASLFSECYHCDAVAAVGGEVWCYPKKALSARLQAEPEALWTFAQELARHVQKVRLRYEIKHVRSAQERVLQYLRLSCAENGDFHLPGVLKDVAADVGLSHEAFYRALASLEKSGRIARGTGAIRLVGFRE